jgi:hypothetical protein
MILYETNGQWNHTTSLGASGLSEAAVVMTGIPAKTIEPIRRRAIDFWQIAEMLITNARTKRSQLARPVVVGDCARLAQSMAAAELTRANRETKARL